ncbi:MAG: lipopolysaccharide biosynthesis protein RfbH [Candidatus Margulisiibacteriota bacterium]
MAKDAAAKKIKKKIFELAKKYYSAAHQAKKDFKPGDKIGYGGRIFDEKEILNLIDSALEFWLTAGRFAAQFEDQFAQFLGVQYCSLVNSGSSANLLAFMALTSPKLEKRQIRPGDEVITVAAGFPTTIAPIVQYGAVPVFVDVMLPSYNIDCAQLQKAVSKKTRAVMLAHTLGNPFDLKTVKAFCAKHGLWLIEDNCDSLGSRYKYKGKWQFTGTFGDIATSSFYPPHHMTMGEGGAVYTNNLQLKRIVESMRDWGRDCWCAAGKDNTCGHRFEQQFGELPLGYDHKYVYSHLGYNFKVTDMQAAVGCAQLEKLPAFIAARKNNWDFLRTKLDGLSKYFVLPEPAPNSEPSWFGFLLTVKENAGFSREAIVNHLEAKGIQTRMLFAGNMLKHPCFDAMRRTGRGFRVASDLKNTDTVMNRTFWIGVYPGMTKTMLAYMVKTIKEVIA